MPSLFFHIAGEATSSLRRRANLIAKQLTERGVRTQLSSSNMLSGNQGLVSASPTVTKRWEQFGKPLRGIAAQPEGYRLTATSEGILIQGFDERGFYLAGQTLRQLLEDKREVPGLEIEDGPLLTFRAMHLDFRGWPPTREYLQQTIERLSGFKLNTLILEYESHFAFNSQPGLSCKEALPPNFIAEMDIYAQDRGVMLVPLQHCIGNLGYLLKLEPYKELREDPRYLQQICPLLPATLEIYTAMAEDLLAAHSAKYFHMGGDQARFLGGCPDCKARAKQLGGRASLYLEYIGKIARYLISRTRVPVLWDDQVRNMTDAQIQWLPSEAVLAFSNYTGQGGRATPAILVGLDRYKQLGRRVWGAASRLPSVKHEAFDNIDAWSEAAEFGYLEGLITTTWTREYTLGPLLAPPEIAWPGAAYAAERSWGGRKNATREAFQNRFGARFFGLQERAVRERLWGVYDLMAREYPREARECIHQIYSQCTRNQETLSFLDIWCRLGAFHHYLLQFEKGAAADYANLQAGNADPFHASRLHWRVEELRSKVPDLTTRFREHARRLSTEANAEEYMSCNLAYGMRRLDELAQLLEGYPPPEKEWQQPVRV